MATLTCPSPINVKPLVGSGNYIFSLVKFPELTFMIHEVELPQITLGTITTGSSVHDYPIPGETMEFASMTCTFMVDEKMENYLAIWRWIVGMGFPEGHFLYRELMKSPKNSNDPSELARGYSDGVLTILDNNQHPLMQATFVDCFPTTLSGVNFTSTQGEASPIIATVNFEYSYYRMETA
jgi:hypothetical protein